MREMPDEKKKLNKLMEAMRKLIKPKEGAEGSKSGEAKEKTGPKA